MSRRLEPRRQKKLAVGKEKPILFRYSLRTAFHNTDKVTWGNRPLGKSGMAGLSKSEVISSLLTAEAHGRDRFAALAMTWQFINRPVRAEKKMK